MWVVNIQEDVQETLHTKMDNKSAMYAIGIHQCVAHVELFARKSWYGFCLVIFSN